MDAVKLVLTKRWIWIALALVLVLLQSETWRSVIQLISGRYL